MLGKILSKNSGEFEELYVLNTNSDINTDGILSKISPDGTLEIGNGMTLEIPNATVKICETKSSIVYAVGPSDAINQIMNENITCYGGEATTGNPSSPNGAVTDETGTTIAQPPPANAAQTSGDPETQSLASQVSDFGSIKDLVSKSGVSFSQSGNQVEIPAGLTISKVGI